MKLARILFTVQETAKKINEDKITAYAAQTCYYLLLSFMPFIIALINIIHYFPVTSSDLLDLLENIIPQEFHPMLINIFTDIESSSSVALLSLTAIGLLWSAGKGFMTIKRCLNKINNCEYNRSWFIQRIFSSLYALILLLSIAASLLIIVFGEHLIAFLQNRLASLGGKKDAKRAAMIHFLFNVVGSAIAFIILMVALDPITQGILHLSGGNTARAVANAHTLMKVFEVVVLFPFMGWIVKATYMVVPGKDATPEDEYELLYIGGGSILSPTTAVLDGIREIEHMGKIAIGNLKKGMDALCSLNEEEIDAVYHKEKYIDFMNRKITDYLVKVNEIELPIADARLIGGLFHVVNDIERIGDHAENFADSAKMRIDDGVEFSDKAIKQLQDMTEKVIEILEYSLDMFSNRNQEHMQEILNLEDEIDDREKKLQRAHVKRLTKNKCTPEAGMIFSDTISGLERVADHAPNIAFAILEPDEGMEDEDEE